MSFSSVSPVSLTSLLSRTIGALAKADVTSMAKVLADCADAELPGSPEEFSRALTQKAALEKALEQTRRNIRLLRGEENSFRYGHSRGRNS
jgi:predicted transcriptional regulator of viral defense system